MGSSHSDGGYLPSTLQQLVKIVVLGDFGVGKTSLIAAVSEIAPLTTEEPMTRASVGIDDLDGLPGKDATTVAMDFGRLTLNPRLALFLFGAPGQQRFWDVWREITIGAAGVLVMVDTRRLAGSFEVLDLVETQLGLPYAVAVNTFPDSVPHSPEELRTKLDLAPDTPLRFCNALDRGSAISVLVALVQHAVRLHTPTKAPA